MSSSGKRLRAVLKEKKILLPGAFNALSAQLIEQAGFEAVYISGAGLANGLAGLPDIGLLSLTEVTTHVQYITGAIDIPAIADADTGFGEGLHFCRAMQLFEAAGVGGIQIEDQEFPKRCGHLSGKTLIPEKAMCDKIKLAVECRTDPDLLIIARTDSRGVTDMQDAVHRAKAYLNSGADVIFPEALQSKEEFAQFAKAVNGPLLANMTEFGKSPNLSAETLFALGYQIVLFPMTLFRLAAGAMAIGLEELKKEGQVNRLLNKMQTREALYALLKYDDVSI